MVPGSCTSPIPMASSGAAALMVAIDCNLLALRYRRLSRNGRPMENRSRFRRRCREKFGALTLLPLTVVRPSPSIRSRKRKPTRVWSADGSTIAFGHNILAGGNYIALFDLKSRQITRVPGSDSFFGPRFSPDGKHIVALSQDNLVMMLYDTRTHSWKKIFRTPDHIGYIAWSRDSSSIYFATNTTAQPGYYKLRVSDGKLERVADLKPYRFFPGQFGGAPWTSIAPTARSSSFATGAPGKSIPSTSTSLTTRTRRARRHFTPCSLYF